MVIPLTAALAACPKTHGHDSGAAFPFPFQDWRGPGGACMLSPVLELVMTQMVPLSLRALRYPLQRHTTKSERQRRQNSDVLNAMMGVLCTRDQRRRGSVKVDGRNNELFCACTAMTAVSFLK